MADFEQAPAGGDITRLIQAAHAGDSGALDALFPRLYGELRRVAHNLIAGERANHTLQATALVHETWLRLSQQHSLGVEQRAQFFEVAAATMRRVLVDHARRRGRVKRGSGEAPQPLDEVVSALEAGCGDLVELEEALAALARMDPRKARLVELRFFAGLELRDAAEVLAISHRQAERDWTLTRAFLRSKLDCR